MRASQLISSSIQLLFASLLMALAGLCFAAGFLDSFKQGIMVFFTKDSCWSLLGTILIGFSLILFTAFFYLYRRRFYRVSMGGSSAIEIHTKAIKDMVAFELNKIYPQKKVNLDVEIQSTSKGQLIEIKADLPETDFEEQKLFLHSVENSLQSLFERQLGYHKEFILNVSFK